MKKVYFFITVYIFATTIYAQSVRFEEKLNTPFYVISSGSVAFEDIDGDSDLDAYITGWSATTGNVCVANLFINDGLGNYSELAGTTFDAVNSSSIAFADVDGDNDSDLLISGSTNSGLSQRITKLYLNDGLGNFSELTGTPFAPVHGGALAFEDIDSDGDQDVLITGTTNSTGTVRIAKLYTNNGTGTFTEVVGTPFDGVYVSKVSFEDIDNDKDVLIIGRNNSNTPIAKMYINDGTGSFTEQLGTIFTGVFRGSINFADVDGDNDNDLLITGKTNTNSALTKLYINDGIGNFSDISQATLDSASNSSGTAFSDIDNDGDQDVLITGVNNLNQSISKIYTNDGMGIFSEIAGLSLVNYIQFGAVAFADIDGDNYLDLLITGSEEAILYKNNTCYDSGSNIVDTACNVYLAPDSTEYYTSGNYSFVIENARGCDSTINIDLTVHNVDTTINQNGLVLTSNENGGSYQWMNCDSNTIIQGEVNQSFTPTNNGNYAVIVTGLCTDTSNCISVIVLDIDNINCDLEISIKPNPASEVIIIEKKNNNSVKLEIINITGELVLEKQLDNKNETILTKEYSKGIYFFKLSTNSNVITKKIIIH